MLSTRSKVGDGCNTNDESMLGALETIEEAREES